MNFFRKMTTLVTTKKTEDIMLIPIKDFDNRNIQLFGEYIPDLTEISEESKEPQEQEMFQVTSNLAVDKFLNIIALGYSNGMIKIMKYTNDEIATNPDQQ